MKVLIIGGTRFMGVHLVKNLLAKGHNVTIATRGLIKDDFGQDVSRIVVDRTDLASVKSMLGGSEYDVVIDNIALSSNDVAYLLDNVKTSRYIMISSISVYPNYKLGLKETDFDPNTHPLKWCTKFDDTYEEIKRQAECALFQKYSNIASVAVRFPFVIGEDDYTKRFYRYVEHVVKGLPMNVDNLDNNMVFINSMEAGTFLAWLVEQTYTGTVNASNCGEVTLKKIIDTVAGKTGTKGIFSESSSLMPYNKTDTYSLDLSKVNQWGYNFSTIDSWMNNLLDYYIEMAKSEMAHK